VLRDPSISDAEAREIVAEIAEFAADQEVFMYRSGDSGESWIEEPVLVRACDFVLKATWGSRSVQNFAAGVVERWSTQDDPA